ncbi:MAG: hypothetical protein LBG80_02330 [Bacteroidales bacterium]|jgi:hypothetical protein|nr:hypothetical protein [Bacteroidales bacterium]
MQKKFFIALAIVIVIGAGIFVACKKEVVTNQTKEITSGKQQKWYFGEWQTVSSYINCPIGSLTTTTTTTDMVCSRTIISHFTDFDRGCVTFKKVRTEWYYCNKPNEIIQVTEVITQISSSKLDNSKNSILNDMDYTDINNFELYVDDIAITPGFNYDKSFIVNIEEEDGEVVTISGIFHISYDEVVTLWNELWNE